MCGCWFGICTEPFSLSYGISHSTSPTGGLSVRLFVLLLEGKANFEGTGTITMPSADAIEHAPADLKQRLLAIESVDLSSGYNYFKGSSSRQTCLIKWDRTH